MLHLSELQRSGMSIGMVPIERLDELVSIREECKSTLAHVVQADQSGEISWRNSLLLVGSKVGKCGTHDVVKFNSNRYDINMPHDHPLTISINSLFDEIFPLSARDCYFNKTPRSLPKWNSKCGILSVDSSELGGPWHRDTHQIFQDVPLSELPPFYLTFFLYLNNDSDAATEFVSMYHYDKRDIETIVLEPFAGHQTISADIST